MRALAFALIYVAFFALIGFTVWYTHSAWPLLGLFLTPSMKWEED